MKSNAKTSTIEVLAFPDDGETPNHPVLPALVMHSDEAATADDTAAWFEETFVSHGWSSTWRWGVYDYQHYHCTNHEVLGVAAGSATILLGGASGREIEVGRGDVIVIPAGVGHRCLESGEDFLVVGAYPRGESPDLKTPPAAPGEREQILRVALPVEDPLHGLDGPLFDYWR